MSRLDFVHVATSRGTITISWQSRDAIVERLRGQGDTGKAAADAFDAVGSTREVELAEPAGVNAVIAAIEEWARDEREVRRAMMPDDAIVLRDALYDHLKDRGFHD